MLLNNKQNESRRIKYNIAHAERLPSRLLQILFKTVETVLLLVIVPLTPRLMAAQMTRNEMK
jgi:hypothetical protein